MKQTVNVNLNGTSFVIDSDAYDTLREYFETIRNAFGNTADSREIVSDIEARIAEHFAPYAGTFRVISIEATRDVIATIGMPYEFDEQTVSIDEPEAAERIHTTPPPPPLPPQKVQKRLYRDPDNKMLGGVCAGIAEYFGFDPTWLRIAVALLTLISFSTVGIIYLILWIAIPEADTPLKKLQLRGREVSYATIADTFNEPQPTDTDKGIGNTISQIFAAIGKVCAFLICIVSTLLCICAFSAAVVLTVYAISTSINGVEVWQMTSPPVAPAAICLYGVTMLLFAITWLLWRTLYPPKEKGSSKVMSVIIALAVVGTIVAIVFCVIAATMGTLLPG